MTILTKEKLEEVASWAELSRSKNVTISAHVVGNIARRLLAAEAQLTAPLTSALPAMPEAVNSVNRDEFGFWQHPDRMETPFDETGATEIEWSTYFSERGMEVQHLYMNQFFCCDCVYDAKDIHPALYWNPTPPSGAGWVLMAIFDTEEGPCSEWVRRASRANEGSDT
ncbi:hypothetical protein [Dickeya zeae]|uniref:hypothetical protein n=1 Tax=Dickeya zeae TaxID=204042 RepID=UPI001CF5536B|nr:hypothetical protein [Dickeya zeae]MCA6985441.1 hypothetical protein [Dickeya zeae]